MFNCEDYVSPWFGQVLGLWAGFVVAVQDLLPSMCRLSAFDPRIKAHASVPGRASHAMCDNGLPDECAPFDQHPESWFAGAAFQGGVIAWSGAFWPMDSLPVVEPSGTLAPPIRIGTREPRLGEPEVVQRTLGPPCSVRTVQREGKSRVQFSHAVSFWFPAPHQLCLGSKGCASVPASSHKQHSIDVRLGSEALGSTLSASATVGPLKASEAACGFADSCQRTVQGGSCRSLQFCLPTTSHAAGVSWGGLCRPQQQAGLLFVPGSLHDTACHAARVSQHGSGSAHEPCHHLASPSRQPGVLQIMVSSPTADPGGSCRSRQPHGLSPAYDSAPADVCNAKVLSATVQGGWRFLSILAVGPPSGSFRCS